MVRWIAALALLAAAAPARAATWVTLTEGFSYDSQSARYLASVDAVFVTKRWSDPSDGDAVVDSDWLLLCGQQQRWRLIDAGTAAWSGPFQLVSHDEAYRRRLCDQGRAGSLPAYTGAPPAVLLPAPPAPDQTSTGPG